MLAGQEPLAQGLVRGVGCVCGGGGGGEGGGGVSSRECVVVMVWWWGAVPHHCGTANHTGCIARDGGVLEARHL